MESRKVLKYLCVMTKTIKIPLGVHRELKTYAALKAEGTMEEIAGLAIMGYLQLRGHKFTYNKKSKNEKQPKSN